MAMNVNQRAAALWRDGKDSVKAFIVEMTAMNLLQTQPLTHLRIRQDGVDVLRREQGGEEAVLTVAGLPQQAVGRAVEALPAGLGKDCALEISSGLIVSSRMTLPAESDEIIRAIVRNKVEGIAPWPLDQSLHGHRVTAVEGDAAHVAVDVGVVSRALLEEIVAQLSAAGVEVKATSLRLPSGESLPIEFASHAEDRDGWRSAMRLAAGVAAAAAVLSAIGLGLVWQASAQLASAREETAALTASLRPGQSAGAASLLEAATTLRERRRQRHPAVVVVDELSAILPQNVWLDSLSLDDVRLDLKGQGSGIPAVIGILEQSPFFGDVNFASATQFNESLNAEAFSIGATVEPAGDAAP